MFKSISMKILPASSAFDFSEFSICCWTPSLFLIEVSGLFTPSRAFTEFGWLVSGVPIFSLSFTKVLLTGLGPRAFSLLCMLGLCFCMAVSERGAVINCFTAFIGTAFLSIANVFTGDVISTSESKKRKIWKCGTKLWLLKLKNKHFHKIKKNLATFHTWMLLILNYLRFWSLKIKITLCKVDYNWLNLHHRTWGSIYTRCWYWNRQVGVALISIGSSDINYMYAFFQKTNCSQSILLNNMVYFTKYTIIGHFIDLSMHKRWMTNLLPQTGLRAWTEQLIYMYLQSLHFTSLYLPAYLCGKLIKMTETLNMKINENFVSQKRTGKRFFSNISLWFRQIKCLWSDKTYYFIISLQYTKLYV